MTVWHYLSLMLLGSLVAWVGAIRGALRRQWKRSLMGLVPLTTTAIWLLGVGRRLDWDSEFWEQNPWWLAAQAALLGAVWVAALGAWRSSKPR